MKYDIYAFGNALMDIQAHIQDAFLTELGVEKGNMYLTERDRQEDILGGITGSRTFEIDRLDGKLQSSAGGSAANTVFGVVQLGGKAGLCGKVAGDGFGDLYIKDMQDNGVHFSVKQEQGMTGTSVVLISDDAQRTMLTCLGIAGELKPADIDEAFLRSCKYIYLEGYLFDSECATETLLLAVEMAKKNDVKIALTASDAFCIDRHKEILLKLIKNDVDLLFANAEEAEALTDTGNMDDAVNALAGMCRNIAVTNGEKGSTLCFDEEILQIKPWTISPVDTTGAGDSYAAGLLYGLTNNYTLLESGNLASFYSSRVVGQLGPRYQGNIREEIKTLMG